MKIFSSALDLIRISLLPKQSHPLAKAAKYGLKAKGFPTRKSLCQMFARRCYELAYSLDYEFAHKGTAREALNAWIAKGYAIPASRGSIEGDLLYRDNGDGGSGHVGIRLRGNMVAENSIVHADDSDSRGLRTIEEFGPYQYIVRLPATSKDLPKFLQGDY